MFHRMIQKKSTNGASATEGWCRVRANLLAASPGRDESRVD